MARPVVENAKNKQHSHNAIGRKSAGRRLSDRQSCFLFTFAFVIAAGMLIHTTMFLIVSPMQMHIGRCCPGFGFWDAFRLVNILVFFAFAAIVAAVAAYVVI